MPKGIYYRSPQRLAELTRQIKGVKSPPPTQEQIEALRKRNIGNKYALGLKRTQENKDKIRAALLGVPSPLRGRKLSPELRRKLSQAQQKRVKEGRNNLWRGGIYTEHKRLRHTTEYKLWREAVFKRDDYTCQFCGVRGGKLNADHIKPFALYPAIRFDIDNGRTLCVPCHKTTDTFAGKTRHS